MTQSNNFEIVLDNLSFTYVGTKTPTLKNLSLSVKSGTFTWITGANSSGKSTLLTVLAGVVPRVIEGKLEGKITVSRAEVGTLSFEEAQLIPAMVMQDANISLFRSVFDELAFPLENRGIVLEKLEEEVEKALNRVGILAFKDRLMHTLSGGERQKVAVAAALAVNPDLLLLDEPFEQLDPASVDEVMELAQLAVRAGAAVVVATRDASKVPQRAQHYHLIEGTLGQYVPKEKLHFVRAEPNRGAVALSFDAVSHRYGRGGGISSVGFEVHAGESLAILGPNGAGKTTLMKHTIGLLRPTQGRVAVQGQDIAQTPVHKIALQVGILFQNPDDLLFNTSVGEEVTWGLIARGISKTEAYKKAEAVMQELGISHLKKANPHEITASERQLVAFASVLVTEPVVIVLDEPTKALDEKGAEVVAAALDRRLVDGAAALIVTHHLNFAERIADKSAIVVEGKIISLAPTRHILADEELLSRSRLM